MFSSLLNLKDKVVGKLSSFRKTQSDLEGDEVLFRNGAGAHLLHVHERQLLAVKQNNATLCQRAEYLDREVQQRWRYHMTLSGQWTAFSRAVSEVPALVASVAELAERVNATCARVAAVEDVLTNLELLSQEQDSERWKAAEWRSFELYKQNRRLALERLEKQCQREALVREQEDVKRLVAETQRERELLRQEMEIERMAKEKLLQQEELNRSHEQRMAFASVRGPSSTTSGAVNSAAAPPQPARPAYLVDMSNPAKPLSATELVFMKDAAVAAEQYELAGIYKERAELLAKLQQEKAKAALLEDFHTASLVSRSRARVCVCVCITEVCLARSARLTS